MFYDIEKHAKPDIIGKQRDEDGCEQGSDNDHFDVYGHPEDSQKPAAVFCKRTCHDLGFRFRDIKRNPSSLPWVAMRAAAKPGILAMAYKGLAA